jgi:DNA-binding XRE family transcriptional regulator
MDTTATRPLHEVRRRKGLSAGSLADLSGVSRTTICALENGASEASPSTLQKLAAALRMTCEEVFDAIAESKRRSQRTEG